MTPAFQTLILWLIGALLIAVSPFFIGSLLLTLVIGVPVYYLINMAMWTVDRSSDDEV